MVKSEGKPGFTLESSQEKHEHPICCVLSVSLCVFQTEGQITH